MTRRTNQTAKAKPGKQTTRRTNRIPNRKTNTGERAIMNKQTEKYLAPVQALNALMVENVEKIVALQIKRFEENAKLAVDQLKAVTSVKDVDGLKEFLNGYAEVARQFGERSVEDARTIIELGNTSSVKAQSIFKDAVSTN